MNRERVLLHTGPIVALLRRDEQFHNACDAVARQLSLPLLTCWPVITEAAYLLRHSQQAVRELLSWCDGERFEILPLGIADVAGINQILDIYHDQGLDLADVVLMHLAQRERVNRVFTLDHRHFGIYRTNTGQPLVLLPDRHEIDP